MNEHLGRRVGVTMLLFFGGAAFALWLNSRINRTPAREVARESWDGWPLLGNLFIVVCFVMVCVIFYFLIVKAASATEEYDTKKKLGELEVQRFAQRNVTSYLADQLNAAHIAATGVLVRIRDNGWQILNLEAERGAVFMGDDGSVHRLLDDSLTLAQIAAEFDIRREFAKSQAFPNLHTFQQRIDGRQAPALEAPARPELALPEMVRLRDLAPAPSLEHLVLGVTMTQGQQEVVAGPLSTLVHFVAGGRPGSGKSAFLRMLAYQMAIAREECQLALVDLEGVTFAPFAEADRLLYPIADTVGGAVAIAEELMAEMERRKQLYLEYKVVDSLAAYNGRSDEKLLPIIFLMDEATALLVGKHGAMNSTLQLALRARKFGIWLGLGGQSWASKHIDTGIRDMLAARFQFRGSAGQSRMLVGESGAAEIEVPGRALAQLPQRGVITLQVPLVEPEEILNGLSGQHGPLNPMPDVDVAAHVSPGMKEKIIDLHKQGKSQRAIQLELYNYANGGAAYREVRAVLDAYRSSLRQGGDAGEATTVELAG